MNVRVLLQLEGDSGEDRTHNPNKHSSHRIFCTLLKSTLFYGSEGVHSFSKRAAGLPFLLSVLACRASITLNDKLVDPVVSSFFICLTVCYFTNCLFDKAAPSFACSCPQVASTAECGTTGAASPTQQSSSKKDQEKEKWCGVSRRAAADPEGGGVGHGCACSCSYCECIRAVEP